METKLSNDDRTQGVSRRGFVQYAAAGTAALGAAVLAGCAATARADESTEPAATGVLAATADPTSALVSQTAAYAKASVASLDELQASTKRVLVVVDYQRDFVDGVFGRIEPALAIEDALCDRVRDYQEAGDIVIYTQDTHPADTYDQTREGTFNPLHCVPGTSGWEIYGKAAELLTPDRAFRVLKSTYGSCELPRLIEGLRSQGTLIESLEIAGISTTCRVLHNAILLYNAFPELPIILDERTTAGYSDEATVAQLDQLEGWGFWIKRAS